MKIAMASTDSVMGNPAGGIILVLDDQTWEEIKALEIPDTMTVERCLDSGLIKAVLTAIYAPQGAWMGAIIEENSFMRELKERFGKEAVITDLHGLREVEKKFKENAMTKRWLWHCFDTYEEEVMRNDIFRSLLANVKGFGDVETFNRNMSMAWAKAAQMTDWAVKHNEERDRRREESVEKE